MTETGTIYVMGDQWRNVRLKYVCGYESSPSTQYGICGGRITLLKLYIGRTKSCIVEYNKGWILKPQSSVAGLGLQRMLYKFDIETYKQLNKTQKALENRIK